MGLPVGPVLPVLTVKPVDFGKYFFRLNLTELTKPTKQAKQAKTATLIFVDSASMPAQKDPT
jgi:hypothetical protein